jgi:hypothetical protein
MLISFQPCMACRDNSFPIESVLAEKIEILFYSGSAGVKNTSIPTSVRVDGTAGKTCAQLECSAEKPHRGFFAV